MEFIKVFIALFFCVIIKYQRPKGKFYFAMYGRKQAEKVEELTEERKRKVGRLRKNQNEGENNKVRIYSYYKKTMYTKRG